MLNFLAILEPFKLLVSFLDVFIANYGLHRLVDSSLQGCYVNLLSRHKLKQGFLLLQAVCNQITVTVSLVHALTELVLVIRAALRNLDEDCLSE